MWPVQLTLPYPTANGENSAIKNTIASKTEKSEVFRYLSTTVYDYMERTTSEKEFRGT